MAPPFYMKKGEVPVYAYHPYLKEIKSHVCDIPERLKEVCSSLFVVWNNKRHRMEIHSSLNIGNTFYMIVPFPELDERIIDLVKQDMKIKQQGIYEYLEANNRKAEEENEKEKANWIEDVGKETRWHWQKTKEDLGL